MKNRLFAVLTLLLVAVGGPRLSHPQTSDGGADPDRQTYGQAIGWYAERAAAGDPKAQFYYGLALEDGAQERGVDLAAARTWFLRSAQAGFPLAQYKLGLIAQFGESGGAVDPAAARDWYARAAENGVAEAAYNLGVLLEIGKGGPVDAPAAVRWLEAAARAGIGEALIQLGVLHARGGAGPDGGLAPDGIEALKWLLLAQDADVEQAEALVGMVAGQLPPDASAEARRRAEAWTAAAE